MGTWSWEVADRIKVAVVDAHPLYRQGLANALAGSRLALVAEGATADDAHQVVHRAQPDVLLLDIRVPGDGMAVTEDILRGRSNVKVVVLTPPTTRSTSPTPCAWACTATS
jgi:DNA-binding NarL/FixJ family response regulator